MNKIKITTNPYEDTKVEHRSWIIKGEPQRVDIEYCGKVYSMVLDEDCPRVEVWTEGMEEMERIFDLTEPSNTVLDIEYEEGSEPFDGLGENYD